MEGGEGKTRAGEETEKRWGEGGRRDTENGETRGEREGERQRDAYRLAYGAKSVRELSEIPWELKR